MKDIIVNATAFLSAITVFAVFYIAYMAHAAKLDARIKKERDNAERRAEWETALAYERKIFYLELKAEKKLRDAVEKARAEAFGMCDKIWKQEIERSKRL